LIRAMMMNANNAIANTPMINVATASMLVSVRSAFSRAACSAPALESRS
jgi:hypothetical protein